MCSANRKKEATNTYGLQKCQSGGQIFDVTYVKMVGEKSASPEIHPYWCSLLVNSRVSSEADVEPSLTSVEQHNRLAFHFLPEDQSKTRLALIFPLM
jgi:hypothetical protein